MGKKRGQGEWSYTQRKDGLWTARKQFGIKENGKANVKAFYGKTISEVKAKSKEYELSLVSGIRNDIINKTTVYDYISNWLRTYKFNSVKNTTYDALEDAVEVRLKPYAIANVQLKNLSTEICQKYINELTNSNKKYSLATITKTYNMINQCLTHAENVGDIVRNPMKFVQLPSADKVQTQTKDISILLPDEVDKVVAKSNECFSNNVPKYYYGSVIVLLLYTGMRIGECLGLRWSDIDFDNDTITIDNTIATVVKDYFKWFESLTDVNILKNKATFKSLSASEQTSKLDSLFYDKIFAIEKDKLLYFLLTYPQKTVIVKTGEKQAEKDFIGYEFSNRRGNEGIKMLSSGTSLYDERNLLVPDKANFYIYNAFINNYPNIAEILNDNITVSYTWQLIDYKAIQFEKSLSLNYDKKQNLSSWKYPPYKVSNSLIHIEGSVEKIQTNEILQTGDIPVVSQNQDSLIDGYCNDLQPVSDLPIIVFGDHNCYFKYIDFPFIQGGDGIQLLKCNGDFLPKFFYLALNSQKHFITNIRKYERHYKYLRELYIPCPPKKIQEKIISEIDAIDENLTDKFSKIKAAKYQIKEILNDFEAENSNKTQKLRYLAYINPSKPNKEKYDFNTQISFVEMAYVSENGYISNMINRDFGKVNNGGYTYFENNDIIIAKITPCMENGKCALVTGLTNGIGFGSTEFHVIRADNTKNLPKFLFLLLNREKIREEAKLRMTGKSGHRRVPDTYYSDLDIVDVDIETQKKIVAQVEILENKIQTLESEITLAEEQKKAVLNKFLFQQ